MKKIIPLAATITFLSLHTGLSAAVPEPGYVDFGKLTPAKGAEFVEVNVNSNLISMVTSFAKKDEPEVFEVLKGLKGIRVNVLGLNDDNREDILKRMASVRSQLDQGGWERVVSVMKGEDDVGIFMKTRGPEAVEGLVVTVLQGKGHAVFVNVIGDIRPEKLATLGERFNIEPLKHIPAKADPSTEKE